MQLGMGVQLERSEKATQETAQRLLLCFLFRAFVVPHVLSNSRLESSGVLKSVVVATRRLWESNSTAK